MRKGTSIGITGGQDQWEEIVSGGVVGIHCTLDSGCHYWEKRIPFLVFRRFSVQGCIASWDCKVHCRECSVGHGWEERIHLNHGCLWGFENVLQIFNAHYKQYYIRSGCSVCPRTPCAMLLLEKNISRKGCDYVSITRKPCFCPSPPFLEFEDCCFRYTMFLLHSFSCSHFSIILPIALLACLLYMNPP